MSYRLDQGHGNCLYRIGVEDDGCHSLLDYATIAESAKSLECIARSLNAIVTERKIIQNEIADDAEGNPVKLKDASPVVKFEPPVWKVFSGGEKILEREEKDGEAEYDALKIQKEGAYTRAEVSLHRVETHLLDPSPVSLADLSKKTGSSQTVSSRPPSPSKENNEVALVAANSNASRKPENLSVGETLSARNIRVAVVGNVDAGKSTLIGTLTTSCLDDGRGKSRTSIMKHRHEIESGRTSTAATHLLGFRSTGEPIAGRDQVRAMKRKSEDEVARESYRVITLMDLAGHEKYLKTTIHGVSSGFADHALVLVNARHPPTHMTVHHLNLCCSFGIPVIVVFTKIDGCPEHAYKTSKDEVTKMLRSPEINKVPFAVRDENDVAKVMDKLHALAPMIETSCVTGEGIDLLQKMLFALPKRRMHEKKAGRSFELLVEDIFNVPGVGAVVSGFVNAGELTVGSNCNVLVGPTDDGSFMKTVAKSAHIARINTTHITSGQSACLALALSKDARKKLRRGMVVLKENPTSTRQFDAEICVLKGEGTTIRRSYQAYVHILNVRQSAYAKHIEIVNNNVIGLPPGHKGKDESDKEYIVLRPGSRAKVTFEFAQRPEYIRPGMRMLFRDGRVRGVGIITAIPNAAAVQA